MNLDQYGLVFQEIYERFSDLACQYVRERNYNVTHFAADESGVDKYTKKQPKPEPDVVHDAARCCQVTVMYTQSTNLIRGRAAAYFYQEQCYLLQRKPTITKSKCCR